MAKVNLSFLSLAFAIVTVCYTTVFAQITPTPTPSASASPSVGSSPTPSPSSRPLPIGAIKEIFTLDCNGGLHILPGHPLEINVNLRGARQVLNVLAEEIRQHARCTAGRYVNGATSPLCGELTDEHILRHFVPSIPMLLNFIEPLTTRRSLPNQCMQRSLSDPDNGKPAFAQSFWDTSAMSTVVADYFNFTRLPLFLNMPSTCTYETYMGGVGCKFIFNEPVSYTNIQIGIDTCPNSYVPYVSATCKGPWCSYFFRPCLVNSDCGTSGLVCRNLEEEGSKRSTLVNWLLNLNLAKNTAELDSCQDPVTLETGQGMLANKLRAKLYSLYNITLPINSATDLFFCLPTDSQWDNMQQRLKNSYNEYWETDLTKDPTVGKATTECIDTGCDPLLVGDGTCQLACMSEACKWDGGDCGGPLVRDLTTAYVDSSLVGDTCTIQPGSVGTGEYKWKNIWERCNGWGTCLNSVPAQCSCRLDCPIRSGTTGGAGLRCENCDVESFCPGPRCKYASRHLIGIQDRMQPWDGIIYDGTSIFDFDRKTGINYTTPAAMFEPGTVLNAFQRTIVEFTCAGELGVVAGNGFLQFGIHAPWLQDIASFLGAYVADLAQCRLKTLTGGKFSDAQIETRFMAHHPAFWFYQFFYLGTNKNLDNPFPFSYGGFNTLNSMFPANDPLAFGNIDLVDPLMNAGLRREPAIPPSPLPVGQFWFMQTTDWAKQYRMYSPTISTLDGDPFGECDWHTAVSRDGFGRRCRGTFKSFGRLFSSLLNPNVPNLHNLYFDLRLDRGNNPICTGAATGQRVIPPGPVNPMGTPLPTPTLSATQAKYSIPSFTLVYEGQGTPIMDFPVPCNTDLDCLVRYPAQEAACVDLDSQLLGLKGTFKDRNVDPLGLFTYGLYNVDRVTNQLPSNRDTCSSNIAVDTTLRQLLMSIGGRQRDAGKSSKFCFMKPFNAANEKEYQAWQDVVFNKGTCDLTREYFDEKRICVATNRVDGAVAPFRAFPTGVPAQVNGFTGLGADFIVPQSQSGIMSFQPNQRGAGTFNNYGARMDTVFYLSLPVLQRSKVTNQHRENFRWAIATAMSQFSMGVTPDNVLIISIDDNPGGFQPLPDGSRAGISVGFVLEIPDRTTAANISAELRSNRPGSLGSRAGAVFATLGIVPYRYQREVIFGIRPPIAVPEAGLTGGEIFGIILLVAVIVGCGVYFVRGGTVDGMVNSAKGLVDSTKALTTGRMNITKKKGGVGEVVGSSGSPHRKSSSVEEINPLSATGTMTTTTTTVGATAPRANIVGQMMTTPGTAPTTVTVHDASTPSTAPVLPSQMYVSASKAASIPPPSNSGTAQSYPPTMVASHPTATVPVTQPVMAPTAPPTVTVVGNPFTAAMQQQPPAQ